MAEVFSLLYSIIGLVSVSLDLSYCSSVLPFQTNPDTGDINRIALSHYLDKFEEPTASGQGDILFL